MKYLKAKIYANGYSINEIAKKFNLSEQTLTNWINNLNCSSLVTFLKITSFLNFNSEDYRKLIITEKKEP